MAVTADVFSFGPFRLDTSKLVLWRGSEVVSLAPKAVSLLSTLVRAAGDVVSKDELLARVWPDTIVEESNLTVTVSALRRALGRRRDGSAYVETLSRRGYRFLALPLEVEEKKGPPSIAVLPFRCLQGDEELPGLGVAMADAIITRLGGTGRAVVRPTGAVLKYAHRDADPRDAARELQVESVLEGRYQRANGALRVTVQLVGTQAASPSWTAKFEAAFTSLFAIQDAVAEQVASALDLRLDPREGKARKERPTDSLEAYQAMARGVHFWHRLTPASLWKAVSNFEEAQAHDPSYALAQVGRASAYVALAVTGGLPPLLAWPLAREAVDRALVLDPRLAVTHLVSGYVKALAEWDFEAAESSMRRALALDPRSVSGHQWYAVFLSLLGRHEEAAAHARETLALHPVSIVGHALRGLRLALDGDDAGALVEHQKAIELAPDHFLGQWGRSVSFIRLGRYEEGLSALRVAAEHSEGSVPARLHFAWGLARSARAEEARAILVDVVASKRAYVSPFLLAGVRLALGQQAEAVLLLEKAARDRDPWLALLLVDTRFDEIRSLPGLERLRERVFGGTGSGRGTVWGRPRKSFGTTSGLGAGGPRRVIPSGAGQRALRQRDLSKRHAPGA